MGVEHEVGGSEAGELPWPLTGFVGREADLDQLQRILTGHRLVTLTGAGGCGKSRLALELARRTRGTFPHGTWWADLAGVNDPALVETAIAATFPALHGASAQAVAALIGHLRYRRALIVVDNCEHLAHACARFADALLRTCPHVIILCTSRQPLDVDGEVVWRVPPLLVPAAEVADPAEIHRYEAVQLFLDRAMRRRPGLAVDGGGAAAVARLCRRLDGLPLALELAAAWVSSMTVEQIDAAVAEHLVPLATASPGRPARHQTLEASIDWSHELLSPDERAVLRRLSVFAGSFSIAGARAISGWGLIDQRDVLSLLTRLVDRSLVHFEETLGGRYRLLETVRQYAATKLEAAEEAGDVRHRHLDLYVALGGSMVTLLDTSDAPEHLDVLEAERDNLLAAMSWASRSGRVDEARTLAADLLVFWMARYPAEGLARLEAVLQGDAGDPGTRARAQSAAAWIALYGPFDAARSLRYAHEAVATGRRLARPDITAVALNHLGWAAAYAAPDDARPAFEEAVGLHEGSGDRPRLVHALAGLGFLAVQGGDAEAAERALTRSLDTARQAGDEIGIRRALAFLGALAALHGELDRAAGLLRDCENRSRRLGDRYFIAHALDYLGLVAIYRGDHAAARLLLDEALAAARLSSPMALARTSVHLGHLSFVAGDLDAARSWLLVSPADAWSTSWYVARRLPLLAEVAILDDDFDAAEKLVEEALAATPHPERPWARALARAAQARLLRSRGSIPEATVAAHDALAILIGARLRPDAIDALELLAELRLDARHAEEAARLLGAAGAARESLGIVRPPIYVGQLSLPALSERGLLGDDLSSHLEAGGALSLEEALAYASRGRGRRLRPPAGWESLTPGEHLVADLVAEGLSNADIGERLFISPATVRAHLAHIYTKLGISSRAQLAAGVARRAAGGTASDTSTG